MTARLVFLGVLAAACGKPARDAVGTCKPLTVTVNGTPLAAMPHGLAKANNMNGDISYEVDVFNHDITCEQLLAKTGRTVPDGELSVRAFAAGAGMTGKGIGIDAHTQMGGALTLTSPPPKAVGDVVQVCADHVAFNPIAGRYKDTDVVVDGLFEGTYCGEVTW